MLSLVRDLAGVWADNRFVKANDALRRKLMLAEASVERLTQIEERLRTRRAIDRDVRVRAETSVAELTQANLKLAGLLADRSAPQIDAALVAERLEACGTALATWRGAYSDYLAADLAFKTAYNTAYTAADGPEHLRRAAAELEAREMRAFRDEAEVVWRDAERRIRLAEQGLRVATKGATDAAEAPESGDR